MTRNTPGAAHSLPVGDTSAPASVASGRRTSVADRLDADARARARRRAAAATARLRAVARGLGGRHG